MATASMYVDRFGAGEDDGRAAVLGEGGDAGPRTASGRRGWGPVVEGSDFDVGRGRFFAMGYRRRRTSDGAAKSRQSGA